MKVLVFFGLTILSFTLIAKEPIRTWTSADGHTLEARYLRLVGNKVNIQNTSGRKFIVPLTRFSQVDQDYVNQVYGRSLFTVPQPFDDDGRGGGIVASAKGSVQVLLPLRDNYSNVKPKTRAVIVGESIASGTILSTASGSSADLLLTNGTLVHLGENTKLVLSALYQKSFIGTKQKASELKKEVSPSRTALKLEEGDLVIEVRKLSKESSFLISTKIAQAGIRGTQFKISASADSAELAVLEGRVEFLDAEQKATSVETAKKAGTSEGVPAKLEDMTLAEQTEVNRAVEKTKQVCDEIDLNRLAYIVDGYTSSPNFFIESALDMELIWCPPGSFIMGSGNVASPVILTKGFYLGKFEVTQEQYFRVMQQNPSKYASSRNFPVERVSWNEAIKFCESLTRVEQERQNIQRGWAFNLPTEAQWEYACKADSSTWFSFGNSVNPKLANYNENKLGKTTEVGSYRANPWGFYDLHGNVWEWCLDLVENPNKKVFDPIGLKTGKKRRRGGAFSHGQVFMRSSDRSSSRGDQERLPDTGFRIALQKNN